MNITDLKAGIDWDLIITAEDGRVGSFDVNPFLNGPVFQPLRDHTEFLKVTNGRYFIEWACGADLSADTIEARWQVISNTGKESSSTEKPMPQGH
jgi:hypothetical protein